MTTLLTFPFNKFSQYKHPWSKSGKAHLKKSIKTDKEIYKMKEHYTASISKLHARNRNRVRSIFSGVLLSLPIAVSICMKVKSHCYGDYVAQEGASKCQLC